MALSRFGVRVILWEMKPVKYSPAHMNPDFAELVCSNSFKSKGLAQASGLLQEEMKKLGSGVLEAAERTAVAAGQALAVDRVEFSRIITERISSDPMIEIVRGEFAILPENMHSIIATGPLGSEKASALLADLTGGEGLYFYDAMAPIIDGASIDREKAFFASRYGKGGDDYLNCPFTKEEFDRFFEALVQAEKVPARQFEEEKVFNACQPIEKLAESGDGTLRFGPMKPVGLIDPRTGKRPWAVLQLRREDTEGALWNMVGFQTKLKHGEQERVFRMIPGLENAVFHRLGSLHRNTYVDGPKLLDSQLRLRKKPWVQLAGQITGVEGYLESAAMGLWAGINLGMRMNGVTPDAPPGDTALGALVTHVSHAPGLKFEPMNMNFGLLPALGVHMKDKAASKLLRSERALKSLETWLMEQEKRMEQTGSLRFKAPVG